VLYAILISSNQPINFLVIADKYNYSKHVSNILSPLLLPLGFKKRAARFTQSKLSSEYFIYLERSGWNSLSDRPDKLSVIIGISNDAGFECTEKLFRITQMKFPVYYAPFFLDKQDWPAKEILMSGFSPKQLEEIDKYLDSISWQYDSEQSLINLLEEIKTQLINVGLPTINYMKERLLKDSDMSSLSLGMKKIAKQLYLEQLNPISRFPVE
jgi:hypothetical protein